MTNKSDKEKLQDAKREIVELKRLLRETKSDESTSIEFSALQKVIEYQREQNEALIDQNRIVLKALENSDKIRNEELERLNEKFLNLNDAYNQLGAEHASLKYKYENVIIATSRMEKGYNKKIEEFENKLVEASDNLAATISRLEKKQDESTKTLRGELIELRRKHQEENKNVNEDISKIRFRISKQKERIERMREYNFWTRFLKSLGLRKKKTKAITNLDSGSTSVSSKKNDGSVRMLSKHISNTKIIEHHENFDSKKNSSPAIAKKEKLKFDLRDKYRDLSYSSFPHVSVVMPCWNRKEIIGMAINSVLGQSYQNFELIISDDGSDDDTVSFIESEYKNEISKGLIKLIKGPKSGVSSARNRGLAEAKGKYIAYLDSDNSWDLEFLRIMIGHMEEKNCATAYCGIVVFNSNKKDFRILMDENYDRSKLEASNFIDLNAFVHNRVIYDQLGGFDDNLTRLVDWDLILKYTKDNVPELVPVLLVNYYIIEELNHITTTENLYGNYSKIARKEYYGNRIFERMNKVPVVRKRKMRFAYVLWEFPVLSESFIISELKWLVDNNYDIRVYYKNEPKVSAELTFPIERVQIDDVEDLASRLKEDKVDLIHSHWIYPTTILLTLPASELANVPFSFTGQGVDMFHKNNIPRMGLREIANSPMCYRACSIGEFHTMYFLQHGVPEEKICYVPMSLDVDQFSFEITETNENQKSICSISRFIEKKGIEYLISAAQFIPDVTINIYGFGTLEEHYKSLIDGLGLTNVQIHGSLETREQVIEVLRENDLFVLPCVQAEDGDMDGLPVVFMEALAIGVPVVTTSISSIPDLIQDGYSGLLSEERSPESIAQAIKRYYSMTESQRSLLKVNGRKIIEANYNSEHKMNHLVRAWKDERLDIFLVSYNNLSELKEIVRRIFKFTFSNFNLTIVDNCSEEDTVDFLRELESKCENVKVEFLSENVFCGPASNIALSSMNEKFAVYLCSKEGFVLDYNWERRMIDYMEDNPEVGIAGHLSYSPSYYHAKDLKNHSMFPKFRNRDFVNKKSTFRHVQGGIYIIRKSMFEEIGGFNPATPHDMMDVEYSYYVESKGWQLGSIDDIYSVTVKTRPAIGSLVDEFTLAAHPLTLESVETFDSLKVNNLVKCCVCEWTGDTMDNNQCPGCHSTAFERTVHRFLAESDLNYRKLSMVNVTANQEEVEIWKKAFKYRRINSVVDLAVKEEPDIILYEGSDREIYDLNEWPHFNQIMILGHQPNLSEQDSFEMKEVYFFSPKSGYLDRPIYLISRI